MSNNTLLEKEWDRFYKACHPKGGVSETQFRETRAAFFAGALTILVGTINSTLEGKSEELIYQALKREIDTATKYSKDHIEWLAKNVAASN